jgi:hypothetical protein
MADEASDSQQENEAAQKRDRNRATVVGSAGIAAVAMVVEAAKPELAPITAALGTADTAALVSLVERVNAKREERARYALGSAITMANMSVANFESRCEEDPDLLQLCTKIVQAAQDAVFQEKLDGLALCLASALEDGSKVNEEILFSSVLAQLEAPHIRLLAFIGRNPADWPLNPNKNPADYQEWAYNSTQLAMMDPSLEPAFVPY